MGRNVHAPYYMGTIYMFTPTVISFAIAQATLSITTERSEWRNLFKDVSTVLDMTGVNSYIKTKY